jgi:hypothetical protein
MHRTFVVPEVTRGAETGNTVRETYVKQNMVEISLDLTGKVIRVMTSRHPIPLFQTLNTSSENDPCYCESPAKYSSTYVSISVPGIFEIAARHHSSSQGSRVKSSLLCLGLRSRWRWI